MEYFTLWNGIRMPALGFGTWTLRGQEGREAIRTALEVGYRLLDTARMYENEEAVGQAVKDSGLPRQEIFLTTKLWQPSNSYQKAREDIDRSLRALAPTMWTCCCFTSLTLSLPRCTGPWKRPAGPEGPGHRGVEFQRRGI